MDELEQLRQAIAALESQRAILGDEVVDTALASLQEKLASLQKQTVHEQRKLISVLFADLVGFTALSERIDAEDMREILGDYFRRWTSCIQHYGGRIEKFIGDAVMAVFGLEVSQEDDPERAIRAALAMRETLQDLNNELEKSHGISLSMRVGIHTGQAVVSLSGERVGSDFAVVGETVNLASRLQTIAPINGILISHSTYRHVRGVFDVKVMDPVQVKGIQNPIQVYLVLRSKPLVLRLVERSIEGIETRLIGREEELQTLKQALNEAKEQGIHRTIFIVGEAGVGKSRLLYELENWLELLPEYIFYYRGRASPYLQKQPYSLARDVFSTRFQIQDSDPLETVRQKMEQGIGDEEAAHFIGQLLGFDFSDSPHLLPVKSDSKVFHQRALEHLTRYFRSQARMNPVVILLEDLHLADDPSLDLLEMVSGPFEGQRLLIIAAARPRLFERRPEWIEGRDSWLIMKLGPLSEAESRRLADEILQKLDPVPDRLRRLLVDSAEGNPYYMEELVKMLLEEEVILRDGDRWQVDLTRLSSVHVPSTLTEMIQARYDSLPQEERLLLQPAAVVGRIFWDQAVAYIYNHSAELKVFSRTADEISQRLDQLRKREIIYAREQSTFENSKEYVFRHALFRDVIYESVLRRVRRDYHALAARWLEEMTTRSQRASERASVIAGHYEQAGENEKAAAWYRRAGEHAVTQFAHDEAVHTLSRALELTPHGDTRLRYEILRTREQVYNLQGARELQQRDLQEMEKLARRLKDDELQAEVLIREASLAFVTGDYPTSIAAARKALPFARAAGSIESETQTHLWQGRSLAWLGNHQEAAAELESAYNLAVKANFPSLQAESLWNWSIVASNQADYSAAYDMLQRSLQIYREIDDIIGESAALGQLGVVLLSQEDHEGARRSFEQALQLYRRMGLRFRECIVLNNLGIIAYEEGRLSEAMRLHEESLEIELEINDRYGIASSLGNIGDIHRDQGDYPAALEYYRKAIDLAREMDDRMLESILISSQAMAYLHSGDPETALEYSRLALQIAREMNVPFYEAQALPRTARIYFEMGDYEQAVQYYKLAIDLQQSKALENRAVESTAGLARALLASGQQEQALDAAGRVVEYIREKNLVGVDEPVRVYLNIYHVLAAGQDPRAGEVLQTAYQQLMERADRIDDPEQRRSYLENVAANREVRQLYYTLYGEPGASRRERV